MLALTLADGRLLIHWFAIHPPNERHTFDKFLANAKASGQEDKEDNNEKKDEKKDDDMEKDDNSYYHRA